MNPKPKIPRAEAIAVAREICTILRPVCERLIVAGSLRRRKAWVGDVEILYIPKFATEPDGLFDTKEVNLADRALEAFLQAGLIKKRPKVDGSLTWGAENKLALHTDSLVPVDLFQAKALNWFNQIVCRTGSAENNIRISNAARKKGWEWHPHQAGFTDEFGQIQPAQCEADVFQLVGLPYVEPWQR